MGVIPPTVLFLARAARLAGAFCILIWLIAAGITLLANPDLAAGASPDLMHALEPSATLYLLPGLVLMLAGFLVKAGRLWPAPVILLISILSLFKLVLLLLPLRGPIFAAPLWFELPARIVGVMLSVPCVFAWEDLSEVNRTRARRRKSRARTSLLANQTFPAPPPPAFPPIRPPPPSRRCRPPIRPDDPPTSRTPWS